MALFVPKRTMQAEEMKFGVCVWRFPNGSYLMDKDQNYLSTQGRPYDKEIESRMKKAVYGDFGDIKGEPFWLPGFRKISESEWDDEMETLLEGGTPDPTDLVRQIEHG